MKEERSPLLSDQMRNLIESSGVTRYRMAQETGVSESTLSYFVNGKRGLSMEALDAIGEFLDLEIVIRGHSSQKGRRNG
jgi:transcriptional regulator with XRE-family HTH domain